MEKHDKRIPVISRIYEKGADQVAIWVYQVTALDITGVVFEFTEFLNNVEDAKKRVVSGNAFHIRKTFINRLLDLTDDGWKRSKSNSLSSEHVKFFEPEHL
jgi:hypothetical protein